MEDRQHQTTFLNEEEYVKHAFKHIRNNKNILKYNDMDSLEA